MSRSDGESGHGGSVAAEPAPSEPEAPTLIAYRLNPAPNLRLVTAPAQRAWMEGTSERFANRCLPLLLANQAGWLLLGQHGFDAIWDGGPGKESLRVTYQSGAAPYPAISHFGHGVLTWHVPYLFRTPLGWNLLARGPANSPKEGIVPLEGLVEADWAVATFTMNWKLTTPGLSVGFEPEEPICMLVPQRRGDLERFRPEVRSLDEDRALAAAHQAWIESRSTFLEDLAVGGAEAVKQGWQRHYFRGTAPDGLASPEHQTKLRLREFDDPAGWCPP